MHFVDAKGILSAKNGMNLYRGCTHGCIYCDSRSHCYGFTHDFEDIEVKQNAPALLEKALRAKRKKCMIGTGAMCDPYMHCEETLKLSRKCLEIIEAYEFGVTIQTKSDRILRDLDLLERIHKKAKCVVQMTLTTYDEELCKIIEPHVCTTKERVKALQIFHEHQIPTVVWLSPILPFINGLPVWAKRSATRYTTGHIWNYSGILATRARSTRTPPGKYGRSAMQSSERMVCARAV